MDSAGRRIIDPDLPWEYDPYCRHLVARHPRGMTHAQIGEHLGGLSRERVRQIEMRALAKLRRLAGRDRHVHDALTAFLGRPDLVNPWDELAQSE